MDFGPFEIEKYGLLGVEISTKNLKSAYTMTGSGHYE